MTDKVPAAIITDEQLAALSVDQLRDYMPALVNAFQVTWQAYLADTAVEPDYSRLQLHKKWHNAAYGIQVMDISHAEYLAGLKNDPIIPETKAPEAPAVTIPQPA